MMEAAFACASPSGASTCLWTRCLWKAGSICMLCRKRSWRRTSTASLRRTKLFGEFFGAEPMPAPAHRRPKGLFVGLATVDLTYPVDEIPWRNQKISVPGQHLSAGGPATNAAITFGFLGGAATLVTAVG